MTQRRKKISRSRKQAGQHDLEKKKWFLGQGSRQASMTQRGKLISRSRKWASQHDPEGKMISRSRKQANQHDPVEKSTLISI